MTSHNPSLCPNENNPPTGKMIVDLALQHLGEAYRAGVIVPMNDPHGSGPWDCAEFASWLVFQASGQVYGTKDTENLNLSDAYTGYWAEQAEQHQAIVSIESAAKIEGAFILRKPSPDKKGHIVISDGSGGTIEAHSLDRGVVRETLSDRAFDHGILVPNIQYSPGA